MSRVTSLGEKLNAWRESICSFSFGDFTGVGRFSFSGELNRSFSSFLTILEIRLVALVFLVEFFRGTVLALSVGEATLSLLDVKPRTRLAVRALVSDDVPSVLVDWPRVLLGGEHSCFTTSAELESVYMYNTEQTNKKSKYDVQNYILDSRKTLATTGAIDILIVRSIPLFGEDLFFGDSFILSERKSLMGEVRRFFPRGVPFFFTRKLCCSFT